jgi:hypothetical protein
MHNERPLKPKFWLLNHGFVGATRNHVFTMYIGALHCAQPDMRLGIPASFLPVMCLASELTGLGGNFRNIQVGVEPQLLFRSWCEGSLVDVVGVCARRLRVQGARRIPAFLRDIPPPRTLSFVCRFLRTATSQTGDHSEGFFFLLILFNVLPLS